jgi:hypothetical protein
MNPGRISSDELLDNLEGLFDAVQEELRKLVRAYLLLLIQAHFRV